MHFIDTISLWVGRMFIWAGISMILIFLIAFISGLIIKLFKQRGYLLSSKQAILNTFIKIYPIFGLPYYGRIMYINNEYFEIQPEDKNKNSLAKARIRFYFDKTRCKFEIIE